VIENEQSDRYYQINVVVLLNCDGESVEISPINVVVLLDGD
jgi:hypothetical protein